MSSKWSHKAKIGPTPPICVKPHPITTPPGPCTNGPIVPAAVTGLVTMLWHSPFFGTHELNQIIHMGTAPPGLRRGNATLPTGEDLELTLQFFCTTPMRYHQQAIIRNGINVMWSTDQTPLELYDGPPLITTKHHQYAWTWLLLPDPATISIFG